MTYKDYTMDNRARVIVVPVKDSTSMTVLVMYPVGSRYEKETIAGASHFIEHMMFKGTKKRKNTLLLTREIDRLGAEYNAFTGKEYTGYYIKTDVSYTEKALDILSDMLFNSLFDAKEMEREKGPIVEEIRMYKDNPLINIDNIFESLLYKGSPIGRDIAGSEEHVLGYERGEIMGFLEKHYRPDNMLVVVAGGVEQTMYENVEKYFGKRLGVKRKTHAFKPYAFGSGKKKDRIVIDKKSTDQAQLMIGYPAYCYTDKRNEALTVLNTILGGSMSSRLFIQIRERNGLAYMVRSGAEFFQDTGYFYIRAGLEDKNISKALGIIQKEVEKITKRGVTKQELRDAKTHIRGALTLSLEDTSIQANWYARYALFYDRIKTPQQRLAEIDKVTNEDIQKVANNIFKWNKARIAVIGNVAESSIEF